MDHNSQSSFRQCLFEIAAHSAYDMFSKYKFVPNCQFSFSHLGFLSGKFFLMAPIPGHCLIVPFDLALEG